MGDFEADKQPAILAASLEESIGLMEPMLVSETSGHRTALSDLAVDLAAKAAGFRHSLPTGVLTALGDLVRAMNCYYSNLIEGHNTHPIDIERAMKNDYSNDVKKRNLQLEAKAHITVQQWIDEGGLIGRATTVEGLKEIHRRFTELLPGDLLWSEDPESGKKSKVIPGELRQCVVKVGRHIPVSPKALSRFLQRFEKTYKKLGRIDTILAAASAHHRLLWIHPFLDGNGRVARMMSHAMLLEALDTGGIWSIARGLARNEAKYKSLLMACDKERRNDLDGRIRLSEEALAEFVEFFLTTCIDQAEFMESLVEPSRLRHRIVSWAQEEMQADALPPKSDRVLEAVLYRGQLLRSEVAQIIGVSDRQARRVTSSLIKREVLKSESTRAPLYLAFPVSLSAQWMPGLFPSK